MNLKKEYFWLIGIIPFVLIGFYAEPIADDYAYAYRLQLRPFWSSYFHEYFTWNGRFTSNLFVLLNDWLIANRLLYHLAPAAIITSLIGSLYFLCRTYLTKKDSLSFALLATVLYLGSNARISEIIYWYTATVTYTLGTILTLLAIGSLIRFAKTKKTGWAFWACLFILLSSGTNEISMAMNIIVAFAYAIRRHYGWPPILITAIIAAAIVYFAPGNAVRSGFFPNAHNIPYSLGMSGLQTLRFTILALTYLVVPLTLLILWRNTDFTNFNRTVTDYIKRMPLALIVAAIFTALFLSAFLPYFATGLLGQHRTVAFGQFYLITGLLALPLIFFIKFPTFYETVRLKLRRIPMGLFTAGMILAFLFMGNSRKALFETANGSFANQQKELRNREMQIRNAQEDKTLYFESLDTTMLFVIDLGENPEYWINKHQSTVLNPDLKVRTIVNHNTSSH